jgi:hypothetical protein
VLHFWGEVDRGGDGVDVLMGGAHDPGAGVGKDLAELLCAEHGRHRDCDDACAERAQDAADQLDVVGHHEDDPVVAAQTEAAQGRGDVSAQPGQLGVRQGLGPSHRGAVAAALFYVTVDQPCRSVEGGRHVRPA